MTRQKIQIKKIDNISARQVTFCKRRRGLFKKAKELSTLCDAEIALMVFSATGKLFEYSSSSLKQVIERHNSHLVNLNKFDQPSLDLQLESSTYAILSKEIAEKTHELSLNIQLFQREFLGDFQNRYLEVSLQMRGEELQGLNMEELRKLEKLVEGGLNCVTETKGERILKEISALKKQEAILIKENVQLKQLKQMANTSMNHTHVLEQGQLSESFINLCSSADPPQDCDSSDTSLKLWYL